MFEVQTICNECRICKNPDLIDVINLGNQVITSRFPLYGDFSTPSTPITLSLCSVCTLVQLKYSTTASELYEYEYGYRSGISNTMREHLKSYQEEVLSKITLNEGDCVVDIGSNDSTTLQYYSNTLKRIGVDPTGKQFKEYYGDVELIENYFTYDNFSEVYGDLKPKVVSSISMFYDLPDPVQFAKDIYNILDEDGIWTCEQSYIITMLRRNSIDTICHEHLEYYSLTAVKFIADMANFKIIDVKFNECNGGSFRIYFSKRSSTKYEEATELINKILTDEEDFKIDEPELYRSFMANCDREVLKLNRFIDATKENGQKIYIYGASTKGNCLLQYAKINENKIKYAVERNLNKVGKMTSTGIGIISEETMRANPPEYLLVLPWHFRDEIIKREDEYLERGGQLVFPFPHFEIYSKKQKVLVTGCDGMLAKYVVDEYSQGYGCSLYGFSHNPIPTPTTTTAIDVEKKVFTKFYFDIKNVGELEMNLKIIKPDIIIHLAGVSSSVDAFENPINSLEVNGLTAAHICDIIHKNKWPTKFFNASSSEMYKGHVDYRVEENDRNMYHLHPYSIGKIMSHSMVDFYRTTYHLPFYNGVFFTIESKHKTGNFLLRKIADHSKKWKRTFEPITLGPLDSNRILLHASDAAKAVKIILEQPTGDNYIICGNENIRVLDLVIKTYALNGMNVTLKENILYSGDKIVAVIKNTNKGIDDVPINITGTSTKLNSLGWSPTYSVDDIIRDISR
jgi:GDP-D-mannose dehydratase